MCHKLLFSNLYIFATQCCRPWIFQTIHFVRSINPSLKYQTFKTSGLKIKGIRKFDFVAKTQILYKERPSNEWMQTSTVGLYMRLKFLLNIIWDYPCKFQCRRRFLVPTGIYEWMNKWMPECIKLGWEHVFGVLQVHILFLAHQPIKGVSVLKAWTNE